MRGKIFYKFLLSYLALILVFLLFTLPALHLSIRKNLLSETRGNLMAQAELIKLRLKDRSNTENLDKFCKITGALIQARLTFLTAGGEVLGDSSADFRTMENHLRRPEILEALQHGSGSAIRLSQTVGKEFLYASIVVGPEIKGIRFIRLARPIPSIQESLRAATRGIPEALFFGAVFSFIAALLFSERLSRRIRTMSLFARQVAQGDFDYPLPVRARDEIGLLEKSLNIMGGRLQNQLLSLSDSKERMGVILDSISDGIMLLDWNRKILLSNSEMRRFLGLRGENIIGKKLQEITAYEELVSLTERTARSFNRESIEMSIQEESGALYLLCHTIPVLRKKKKEILLILQNVSERKRTDTIRSNFVANASHEMKTPLTAIHGYLETLHGGALDDPKASREFVMTALEHTDRLVRLIQDLLTLSEIETGREAVTPEKIPLEPILKTVMDTFLPKARQKKIHLSSEIRRGVDEVYADQDRLVQILVNLLGNAMKFTPEGGKVLISAEEVYEQDIRGVHIRIKDSGIGIPEKSIPHLGERFYRVDPSRSRKLGGTGLGLAIVKHLLKAHGSKLTIRSGPGKGTEIGFMLKRPEKIL